MDQANLDKFKERLEKLQSEIMLMIREEEDPTVTREALDDVDQTADMLSKQMGSVLSSNQKKNLDKVQDALRKINNHTYGKCTECDADIPLPRLEILPFTQLCVECQTEMENYG